jgi:hypothetical protein
MKLVKLINTSNKRLAFPVRGADGKALVLDPKEAKNVFPATVKHPSVSRYIGQGLEVEGDSANAPKTKEPVAPKAPAPSPAPPAAPTSDAEPSKEEPDGEPEKPAEEPAGEKSVFDLSGAPGIDETNIESVLKEFSDFQALSEATKSALIEIGVKKPHKLINWAKEQK